MDYFQIYLFTRLDVLNNLIYVVTSISTLMSIACVCGFLISKSYAASELRRYGDKDKDYLSWIDWANTWRKLVKIPVIVVIIFTIFTVIIPTQKEAAAIYLIPKISNSQAVSEFSKLPANVGKLLNTKLEQYLDDTMEIKPVKEETKK